MPFGDRTCENELGQPGAARYVPDSAGQCGRGDRLEGTRTDCPDPGLKRPRIRDRFLKEPEPKRYRVETLPLCAQF